MPEDISQEELEARYDALPKHLKEFLFSEEQGNVLWGLAEEHAIAEDKIRGLAAVVGRVILGALPFPRVDAEIDSLGINRAATEDLRAHIKNNLVPLLLDLQNLYGYDYAPSEPQAAAPAAEGRVEEESVGTEVLQQAQAAAENAWRDSAAPTSEPPPPAPEPTTPITESPAPPPETKPAPPPFVIHQESSVESVKQQGGTGKLIRPLFFDTDEAAHTEETPPEARLEIGAEKEQKPEQKSGHTEKPEIRVVNYAGPKTEADPFGTPQAPAPEQAPPPKEPAESTERAPEPAVKPEKEPAQAPPRKPDDKPPAQKDVHPNNIVNLKDLPK